MLQWVHKIQNFKALTTIDNFFYYKVYKNSKLLYGLETYKNHILLVTSNSENYINLLLLAISNIWTTIICIIILMCPVIGKKKIQPTDIIF